MPTRPRELIYRSPRPAWTVGGLIEMRVASLVRPVGIVGMLEVPQRPAAGDSGRGLEVVGRRRRRIHSWRRASPPLEIVAGAGDTSTDGPRTDAKKPMPASNGAAGWGSTMAAAAVPTAAVESATAVETAS